MKLRFWNRFKTHINIIRRDRYQLRLAEWQSDPNLVTVAIKVLSSGELQLMLDVVRNEHPGQRVYADDCNTNVRLIAQARAEGYTMALANFEALGKFKKPEEAFEPTFEDEEIVIKGKQ